jgi:hypothetical protein
VPEETTSPAWHQALAFAVTGQRLEELGRQRQPDVPRLATELERLVGPGGIQRSWSVETTDHLVPAELMEGIGAAQFWAALSDLQQALGLADPAAPAVTTDRPLTAEEQRLVADRPPHH